MDGTCEHGKSLAVVEQDLRFDSGMPNSTAARSSRQDDVLTSLLKVVFCIKFRKD